MAPTTCPAIRPDRAKLMAAERAGCSHSVENAASCFHGWNESSRWTSWRLTGRSKVGTCSVWSCRFGNIVQNERLASKALLDAG